MLVHLVHIEIQHGQILYYSFFFLFILTPWMNLVSPRHQC